MTAQNQAKHCKLCHCVRGTNNGILTTIGWFCYKCVREFRKQTEALQERPPQAIINDIDTQE